MTILIYGGTTEGRRLAERLSGEGLSVEVCVATEYGEQVLQEAPELQVHRGRLSCDEMKELYERGNYAAIIDATHPYATAVSENIRESLKGLSIPFFRLKRVQLVHEEKDEFCQYFSGVGECAEALDEEEEERILLTTGSKELEEFCRKEELKKRLVVRVLPGRESMELCWGLGLEGRQIIAMQGPFSKEMNLAMIRQYNIKCLVTKESGRLGGEDEKLEAAREAGITCMVIRRPREAEAEEGFTEDEIYEKVLEMAGKKPSAAIEKTPLNIVLAGRGMGDLGTMTLELKERLEKTDYLFGAPRLIEDLGARQGKEPYYLAKDILPRLRQLRNKKPEEGREWNVTILFSGDSGFFSGCEKMRSALEELEGARIRILPGISSLSAFSAKIGVSWQDAEIMSAHGIAWEEWTPRLLQGLRRKRKVFLLTSGPEDIRRLGELLCNQGLTEAIVKLGYQISYPNERLLELSPQECKEITDNGLYVAMVLLEKDAEAKTVEKLPALTPGFPDEAFIRGQVPMTKEEIREISICKLGLYEGAIVYDIGSGTGSVAMEIAALSERLQVYALECKPEAVTLIRQNCRSFGAENVHVVEGMAPDCFEGLPKPTHAFIGGSKGRMREILDELYRVNPGVRIVANMVSLEGIAQMQDILKDMDVEKPDIVTVSVSKAKKAGAYHLMQANNPVTIYSFSFCGRSGEE